MSPERTILVSGFEPFGEEKVNPAAETALALDGAALLPGVGVRTVIIPVTWSGALAPLAAAAAELAAGPRTLSAVVMLGQAGGYPAVGLERVAVNASNGKDNAGEERVEQPIVSVQAGGPAAYLSTLPLPAMLARIEAAGLPAFVSNSAGTYLCNFVFYSFLHHLATAWPPALPRPAAGFIHVPYLTEQAVGKKPLPPSMSRPDVELAIRLALEAVAGAR